MRRKLLLAVATASILAFGVAAAALAGGGNTLTVAVYGDSPYGTTPTDTTQTDKMAAFIQTVNADPAVSLVVHVGDIHSGKQYCTENYDRQIASLWTGFQDPLVYTPGDNEWADCHKKGEGGGVYNTTTQQIDYVANGSDQHGDPLFHLGLVRTIFFPKPGYALGGGKLRVTSQAQTFDAAHPTDSNYVENVMFEKKDTLFVTLNIPGGSNNDADRWWGTPTTSPAQQDEIAARTGADLRWLDRAFALAKAEGVAGVVIAEQADMWDLDKNPVLHLSGYEDIVARIASDAAAFAKPVLVFNGDSHRYRSDNPFAAGSPCVVEPTPTTGAAAVDCTAFPNAVDYTQDAWTNHPSYTVPNLHRVVVHGSTLPLEWLKLTINEDANYPASATTFGPFSWERKVQP